ncbi:hypothetical protein WJ438_40620 (plasmid) [Streptomyces sp. GD-15H]|uniref:hypothetical protein n=1 Tax=Streptomyces sp. GD-15H TaxID=3129112 RepID=UPI00311ACFD1
MSQTKHARQAQATPFFELRVGGVHVTVQHPPYRLLTMAAIVVGPLAGATWLTR